MTVYARADISAVSISPAHGGCGQTHSRPAPGGNSVPIWGLTCHGGCEDVLRSDPLWSATHTTIPETPDEVARREDLERRGALEQQESTARALMELAKLGTLPEAIASLIQHMNGNALTSGQKMDRLCKNGHSNHADFLYCGKCGVNMNDGVEVDRGKALTAPVVTDAIPMTDDHPAGVSVSDAVIEDLNALTYTQLTKLAKERGVAIGKSKKEQIALLLGS